MTALEVLATQDHVADLVSRHNLPLWRALYTPSGPPQARRGATGTTIHPTAQLSVRDDPAALIRWAHVLEADVVDIDRAAPHHTEARIVAVEHDGFDLFIGGWIPRRADKPRLPGIVVDWDRTRTGRPGKTARISVDELAVALAELGHLHAGVA